jgi:hypothetical protein
MDTRKIKGVAVALLTGALAFGGLTAAQAAVPGAADAAANAQAIVKPFVLGPVGVLAKLTGLKIEDIVAQRQAGKSLADMAKSKDVTVDKLADEVIAARKAALDVRVKQGIITQAQEDAILKAMRERMTQRFESDAPGGCFGGGRGGAGGRGRGGIGGGGLGGGMMGGYGPGAGAGGTSAQ